MTAAIIVRRIAPAAYASLHQEVMELSGRAQDTNPHMLPAAIAAARMLVPDDRIIILAAYHSEALGFERLAGIWAFARRRDWRSGFAEILVSPLLPLYEVSSAAIIERDLAVPVASAMLRHLLAASDLPRLLALPQLALEGESYATLAAACEATGSRILPIERWSRPMLVPQPGDSPEPYLRRSLGHSYKKRMQQFRSMRKYGALSFRRERGFAARDRLPDFLALEASGWKGEAGSALARIPADTAYIQALVAEFAAIDRLQIDSLLLDGAPIAMGLLIENAGTRHFLKIAYDERHARLSPGRALTIAMLQADFATTPPVIFDSGAGDGVDARTYVWGERREIGHVLIALGGARPGLPHLAARARRWLRRLRARLRR